LTLYSNKRDNGTTHKWTCAIPDLAIECNPSIERIRVTLTEFSIPFTWYQIPEGENSFMFTRGDTTQQVFITPGTYSYHELAKELSGLLDPVVVRYLPNQNKMYFAMPGSDQFTLEFARFLGSILGFRSNIDYTGNEVVSQYPCQPLVTTHLIIKTNLPPSEAGVNFTNIEGPVRPDSTLAIIPLVNTPPFHTLHWINEMDIGYMTSDYKLNQFTVEVTSEDGAYVPDLPDYWFQIRADVINIDEDTTIQDTLEEVSNDLKTLVLHKIVR